MRNLRLAYGMPDGKPRGSIAMNRSTLQRNSKECVSAVCRAGRPRILVVESDALLRWSIVTYLKLWFDVILCDCAAAAKEWLARTDVDAVIISIDQLGITSETSPATWATRGARPITTIVTCTGTESMEPQRRRRRSHGDTRKHLPQTRSVYYLEKPFPLSDLAAALGI